MLTARAPHAAVCAALASTPSRCTCPVCPRPPGSSTPRARALEEAEREHHEQNRLHNREVHKVILGRLKQAEVLHELAPQLVRVGRVRALLFHEVGHAVLRAFNSKLDPQDDVEDGKRIRGEVHEAPA